MRRTDAACKIARVLLADPDARHHGYDTGREAGVRSGSLYPILWRFLAAGWLADGWEDPAEAEGHPRPRRRYYTVTDDGRLALTALTDRR